MRKQKQLSQADLAKAVGTLPVTIGRYERSGIKPSIDVATKIADPLEVSLDYLVGNTDVLFEKTIVFRILDVQKLHEMINNTFSLS